MQDLSQYKYFKKFQSPIMDYIAENYDLLKNDFFENIAKSELYKNKPGYRFVDGVTDLYKGKILSSALKLSTIALDDDERRIIRWDPEEKYRYTWTRVTPNISGPWVDFVKKYDDQLEQMFFNIAFPGATITPHRGITSSYFRVHVCLQENQGFIFNIEGERKHWFEGVQNAFAFDDANLLHGVEYESNAENKPRIVAILDVKKEFYPDLFK